MTKASKEIPKVIISNHGSVVRHIVILKILLCSLGIFANEHERTLIYPFMHHIMRGGWIHSSWDGR